MDSDTASAGWYYDPDSANILRWWDGQGWTEARMPVPTTASTGDRVTDGVGLLLLAGVGLLVLALIWYVAVYLD
jgi:hypothetical protein